MVGESGKQEEGREERRNQSGNKGRKEIADAWRKEAFEKDMVQLPAISFLRENAWKNRQTILSRMSLWEEEGNDQQMSLPEEENQQINLLENRREGYERLILSKRNEGKEPLDTSGEDTVQQPDMPGGDIGEQADMSGEKAGQQPNTLGENTVHQSNLSGGDAGQQADMSEGSTGQQPNLSGKDEEEQDDMVEENEGQQPGSSGENIGESQLAILPGENSDSSPEHFSVEPSGMRQTIPAQPEEVSSLGIQGAERIRSELKSYVENQFPGISYSESLQNASALRSLGRGQNGMDVLVSYGGEEWRQYYWKECMSYAYLTSTEEEGYQALLSSLISGVEQNINGNEGWTEYGVGLCIREEEGAFRVTAVVLFIR